MVQARCVLEVHKKQFLTTCQCFIQNLEHFVHSTFSRLQDNVDIVNHPKDDKACGGPIKLDGMNLTTQQRKGQHS